MALPKPWVQVPASPALESGQCWVHRVTRPGDSRDYALKRLKNLRRVGRFRREVEMMAKLRDLGVEQIPKVIACDLEAKGPYFIMLWYPDGSLEQRVGNASYRDDPLAGIQVLLAVATALNAIHEQGVAHRDVKPANVLLNGDMVLLGDFGLCLQADDDAQRLTGDLEAVGSRLYIAPENESGMNLDVDQRPADFYAFAKLAWATLAGRQPLAREDQRRVGNRLAVIVSNPVLSALDPLFDGLLVTDPRARLTDWAAVTTELEATRTLLRGGQLTNPRSSRDALLMAARKIRDVPAFDQLRAREADEQQLAEWLRQVQQACSLLTGDVTQDLRMASTAANDIVTLNVGSGGQSVEEVDRRLPTLLPDGLKSGGEPLPWGGFALLGFTSSPHGFAGHDVRVGMHVIVHGGEIYLATIPFFQKRDGSLTTPAWLRELAFEVQGPLPLFSAATLARASEQGLRLVRAFEQLARHYLDSVASGRSLLEPPTW